MKFATACLIAVVALLAGAAHAQDQSQLDSTSCGRGCTPFSGACSGLCLCAGPSYVRNGQVYGSSTIVNHAKNGWAQVQSAYVTLYDYNRFVMNGPTSGCVGLYVPTYGGQVTCSYNLFPRYNSNGFSVTTTATARCGYSAQSANLADGQGPSDSSDANVSSIPDTSDLTGAVIMSDSGSADASPSPSPTPDPFALTSADEFSQDASASNGGGRKMLL